MGSGIAYQAALSGYQVVLREVNEAETEKARGRVERWGSQALKRGKITQEELGTVLGRLSYTQTLDGISGAQVVVEAVPEVLELKQNVFRALDEAASKDTLLCTNTSGLSISLIAAVVRDPERVVGTHFFNPVPVMRLVEVVLGERTTDDFTQRATAFASDLGKESVVVKDRPGFVVTRIGQAMINEAMRCLEEGVADADAIDRGMRLGYNYPLGPLELADLVGLDVELNILEDLRNRLGDVFRPTPTLRNKVAAGSLGRKSGQGFYDYSERKG